MIKFRVSVFLWNRRNLNTISRWDSALLEMLTLGRLPLTLGRRYSHFEATRCSLWGDAILTLRRRSAHFEATHTRVKKQGLLREIGGFWPSHFFFNSVRLIYNNSRQIRARGLQQDSNNPKGSAAVAFRL